MRILALCLSLFVISSAHAESKGKAFNPDISVNFLGFAQHGSAYSGDRTVDPHNGFSLQEAELQVFSDVDTYFRASALFSVAPEGGVYSIDPEEVFLETISLPYITVKAGKFKMALGKHNQLHTHAFPFIDAPLIHTRLLGGEGLNESGVSVAGLIPGLPWYSELTLQAFTLSNEELFNSSESGDYGTLAHFKNLWDLSDSLTLEFGLSGVQGRNKFRENASVVGSDLTLKWRPTEGGKYHALIWSSEYLYGYRAGLGTVSGDAAKLGGLATWLQYQFAERWWVQGRFESIGLPHSPEVAKATKESALLAFLPSEFSGLRLQYDWIQDQARAQHDHAIALQFNITLGAHPAHAY